MKALLAGLAVIMASPAAAADPALWKDWMAGCDEAKHCRALALPPEDNPQGLILILDRASGAAGQLTVRLTATDGLGPGAVNLLVDGKPFPARIARDADAARWDGEAALGLARALAAGQQAIAKRADKPLGTLSLAGATAAMLFLDEAQGRVGSKAALVRPGRKADESPPGIRHRVLPYPGQRTAPAPASLPAALRSRGVLKAADCDAPTQPSDAVYPLDATHTLVLLECGSGAYNLVQRPFLVDNGVAATARPLDGEPGEGIVNADFDPRNRTLGGLNKGRGIGDCGSIDRWAWTGKAFVKVQTTTMDVCRGVPPEWWITTGRSELAIAF